MFTGVGAGMVSVKGRPSLPFWLGMEIMISLELVAIPLLRGSVAAGGAAVVLCPAKDSSTPLCCTC